MLKHTETIPKNTTRSSEEDVCKCLANVVVTTGSAKHTATPELDSSWSA